MARLRHNDSQVHFAAIESSSPLAPDAVDSQLLTERQKEVKERQEREAAAIFPDIRSSPRSGLRTGGKRSPPKLILSGSKRSHANLDVEDSSPVLPSDDALMKDVFGSSPTPRSNRRVTLDLGSDFEPPSSPPTAPSVVAALQLLGPRLTPSRITQDQVESTNPEENVPETEPEIEEVRLPREEPVLVPHFEEVAVSKRSEAVVDNTNPKLEDKPSNEDDHNHSNILPCSDADMFVDAPSEPAMETPAAESGVECSLVDAANLLLDPPVTSDAHAEPKSHRIVQQVATPIVSSEAPTRARGCAPSSQEVEISGIMDSFYDESTSFYSNEDDQIAAQLVNDLERASQQASPQKNKQTGTKSQLKKGRKRKSETGSFRNSSKRVKAARGIEVVIETRKPGDINDCVIVDSRRAMGSVSPSPQEIKQERSPSPSGDIGAVAKANEAKATPIRRTRSSTGGAPTIENLLPPSRRRKGIAYKVEAETDGNAMDIVAPPSSKRRSARLSQASVDSIRSQDMSSAEDYKNSAEVSYDRLSPKLNSSDRNSQSQWEPQSESMDQGQDGNQVDEVLAASSKQAHGHWNPTRQGLEADVSGVAEDGAPPPVANNEALRRALRKRPRQTKTQEAEDPQGAGSAEGSLDEEEHNPKRQAMDTARPKEQDPLMQHDVNADAPHAATSFAPALLRSLRQWIGDVKRAVLEPEEEREIVSLMFESIQEVHEAGRRISRT